jgi:hypothetical protein
MVDNRKEKITVYLSIIICDFLFKFLVSGTYSYIIFALIKDAIFHHFAKSLIKIIELKRLILFIFFIKRLNNGSLDI